MRVRDIRRELIEKEKCPCWGLEHVIKENPRKGEYFCSKCGFVSDFPYIDETSEYRQFAMEHGVKDKSRSSGGGDEMVEELGTGVYYDGTAKSKKLAKLNQRLQADPTINKLKKHVRNIKNICGNLLLSKTVSDRACKIFKEADEKGMTRQKKAEAVDAACIYYACQDKNTPKTMNEILQFTNNVSQHEMDNLMNEIKTLPSLESVGHHWENLVEKYAKALGLSKEFQVAAKEVAECLRDNGIGEGQKPQTRAAAVIAFVSLKSPNKKDHVPLEDISRKTGPKKETISQRLPELEGVFQPLLSRRCPKFQALIGIKS